MENTETHPEKAMGIDPWETALSMALSVHEVCHWKEILFPGGEARWPQEIFVECQFCKELFCPHPNIRSKGEQQARGTQAGRKFGQGTWKELLQDRLSLGREGEHLSSACAARGKELLLPPSLSAENEEMKLCLSGVNDLDCLRLVYSVSILNILSQIKANSAFRATGERHRTLFLQSGMCCLQLPLLPGDWVSSASPALCGGALHLLEFKKTPKHSSGCKGRRHFRDLGS